MRQPSNRKSKNTNVNFFFSLTRKTLKVICFLKKFAFIFFAKMNCTKKLDKKIVANLYKKGLLGIVAHKLNKKDVKNNPITICYMVHY